MGKAQQMSVPPEKNRVAKLNKVSVGRARKDMGTRLQPGVNSMSSSFGDAVMERSIGQASATLGLSQDTLRYYEKIGLVPKTAKNLSGRRTYSDKDLLRLRFVQRAQRVGF